MEPRVGRGRPGRTTPYTGGVSPHQFDEDLKIGLWLFFFFFSAVTWRHGGAGYGKSVIPSRQTLKYTVNHGLEEDGGLVSVALGAARARGGVCQIQRSIVVH